MSEIHFHLENASSQFVVGLGLGLVIGFLGCCVLGFFFYRFLQKDTKAVLKELRESAKESRKNFDLILKEKDAKIQELRQQIGTQALFKPFVEKLNKKP